jgi:cytochrome c oxidase assembly protein subunit 15
LRYTLAALPRLVPLHRFAVFLACAVVLLIAAGGLVKSKEAGLSVPDWPTSYGGWNPPRWWQIDTVRAEHGHRLIAGTVGLLTIGLALWTQRREPRRWVRRLAWTAVGAVVAQALLGGLTVRLFLPPAVSIAHAALAQAFLCLVTAVAVVTSKSWQPEQEEEQVGSEEKERERVRKERVGTEHVVSATVSDGGLRRLAIATTALVYLQILVGAVMRHNGAGLAIPTFPDVFGGLVPPSWSFGIGIHYAHRVGALLVALVVAATAARALARHRARPAIALPALAMLALVAAQITLGAMVVLTQKAVLPNTAHVATGAALLAASLVLALETWRGERVWRAVLAGEPASMWRGPLRRTGEPSLEAVAIGAVFPDQHSGRAGEGGSLPNGAPS